MSLFEIVVFNCFIITIFSIDPLKYSRADLKSCPGKPWKQYGNSCFLSGQSLLFNWTEGDSFCKSLGANLASIHSEQELIWLTYQYNYFSRHWLGLIQSTNGTYHWTDGTPQGYITSHFTVSFNSTSQQYSYLLYGIIWMSNGQRKGHPLCRYMLDKTTTPEVIDKNNGFDDTLDNVIGLIAENTLKVYNISERLQHLDHNLGNATIVFQNLQRQLMNITQDLTSIQQAFLTLDSQNKSSSSTVDAEAITRNSKQSTVRSIALLKLLGITGLSSLLTTVVCYLILIRTRIKYVIFSNRKADDKRNILQEIPISD